MKKALCLIASLMMLSTVLSVFAVDDVDSSAAGLTEFPHDNIGMRIAYDKAGLPDIDSYAFIGVATALEYTCINIPVLDIDPSTLDNISVSGYTDLYVNDMESSDRYMEEAIYHVKLNGSFTVGYDTDNDDTIFCPDTDDEYSAVVEKLTPLYDAMGGRSDYSDVSSLTATVSFDIDFLYRDYREYSKTPFVEGGDTKWTILDEVTNSCFNQTFTVNLDFEFTDATTESGIVSIVESFYDYAVTEQDLPHDPVTSTQSITKTTGLVVGTSTATFGKVYKYGPETNQDVPGTDFDEIFEERSKELVEGDGYTSKEIDRNELLAGLKESKIINLDVFPFYIRYLDGDNEVAVQSYLYGEKIVPLDGITKEGSLLAGWTGYTDGMTMPSNDVVFTADWNKKASADDITVNGRNVIVSSDTRAIAMDGTLINTVLSKSKDAEISLSFSDAKISLSADALKRLSSDASGDPKDFQISVSTAAKLDDATAEKAKAK
ncbi:MAG: hypothetical protein J5673_03460, partial [Candidatus Methanomethylophilaceae archaeon]|nr:hypothetical protein [Candidatus Methanomethylophilaceae archaeon]